MIEKIIGIKNVGRFSSYACAGRIKYGKLTVIFGENGTGKSTLSAILRSFSTGIPRHIDERKRLGSDEAPEVTLLTGTGRATFTNGTWNTNSADLEIYDGTFVEENVFIGGEVRPDQRSNLYEFVVGADGVLAAKNVFKLDNDIKSHGNKLKSKAAQIEGKTGGKLELGGFLSLNQIDDIDTQIQAKEAALNELKKADQILDKSLIEGLDLPTMDVEEATSLLAKDVGHLAEKAAQRVHEHLSKLSGDNGLVWLRQGTVFETDGNCPFCGQTLEANELVAAYGTYFSDAYSNLEEEVLEFVSEFRSLFSKEKLADCHEIIRQNESLSAFWNEHVDAEYPELSSKFIAEKWNAFAEGVVETMMAKQGNPANSFDNDDRYLSGLAAFDELREHVGGYCENVEKANEVIGIKKQEIESADTSAIEQELARLRLTKLRFSADMIRLCDEYREMSEKKRELDAEKQEAKTALQHYHAIFEQYEAATNRYLQKFAAGFKVDKVSSSYKGGTPKFEYALCINEQSYPLVDTKDKGIQCFKNTLSSGDKSTLALAFFLSRLEHDPDVDQKTIVFDDPLSSLDGHRKMRTLQEINRVVERAQQVIVLSHDPLFLSSLWRRAHPDSRQKLRIFRSEDVSDLREWEMEKDLRSKYHRNYFTLLAYLEEGLSGDALPIAQCIRPLLEGNLRFRFPNDFKERTMFGQMIREIKDASPDSPLCGLQGQLADLDAVNEYSSQFHHDDATAGAVGAIPEPELRAYVEQAFKLVHS